jgi:predicted nucleic acid-binding protein
MTVYLLDTCIWRYWFNPKSNEHINVIRHIEQLSDKDKLGISVITWGEIEYGHLAKSPNGELPIQNKYNNFIKEKGPILYPIDIHVTRAYGMLKAKLFEKYGPKENKTKGKRPEQLIDPITSKELGIQENDLWIASQAMTRNMVFVTNDKLANIKTVAGPELRIENWAK